MSHDIVANVLAILFLAAGTVTIVYVIWQLTRPVYQSLQRDLERPSHFLYLILFIGGAFGSANLVFTAMLRPQGLDGSSVYYFTYGFLLFISTNLLHQYLIYRTCSSAESKTAPASDYAPWWTNTPFERSLRLMILALLLFVSGEAWHLELKTEADVVPVAIASAFLFAMFLLWNLVAMWRLRQKDVVLPTGGPNKEQLGQRLKDAALLDGIAALLWVSVARTDWLLIVILCAFTYAFLMFKTHILRKTAWHRLYVVIAALAFLVIAHWQVLRTQPAWSVLDRVLSSRIGNGE